MIIAMGANLAIRVLVGIEATYVLGEAYIEETGADPNSVDINKQIGRKDDTNLPNGEFKSAYKLRPDILDRDRKTVYEVRSSLLSRLAASKVDLYIGTLAVRYPGEIYRPGDWQPHAETYVISTLPGVVGLPPLQITAENIGGGVIKYDIIDNGILEVISILASLKIGVTAESAEKVGRPALQTGVAILLAVMGLV